MSKSVTLLLILVILTTACLSTVRPINAESETIIVPDDYPTIAAAIGNATEGDIVYIMKGIYETPQDQTLVITKAISLVGEDADSTIIKLHPAWEQQGWNYLTPVYDFNHPIEIQASDVEISGLTISGDGGSILATGSRIQIRNSKIMTYLLANGRYQNVSQNVMTEGIGCYGSFNTIAGNRIVGGEIVVGGSSGSSNMIYDNIVTDGGGIVLIDYGAPTAANGNTFFNNTVKNCSLGLAVMLSGYSSNNTVYHNNFISNNQQVNTAFSGFLDDGKEGNYWSDYAGSDTNGDGVGDTPYGKDRYPLMYPWAALDVSVLSLDNSTFSGIISVNFTVNKPTQWIGYSLDGDENVTVTENITISRVSSGLHNMTVYAIDVYGLSGASETVYFSVAKEPAPAPFPAALVAAASGASAVFIGVGLLVYFKKRKH